MRALVLKAKGNTTTLKPKMLCGGGAALLKALAGAGYLKRMGGGKHLLQRGTPMREALEQGRAAQLLEQLHLNQKPQKRRK